MENPSPATVSRPGPKHGAGVTRERVRKATAKGEPVRKIAERLGISTQAVNQHIRSLRADGELPEEGAA